MLRFRSALASGALALTLLVPMACSGARGYGGGPAICQQTVAWGGWDGTPQCAGLASTLIAAEDRACETDADCALVAVTSCGAHAVHQNAFPRYASLQAPCSHPLAGMCPPANYRPACQGGCCVPTTAPPAAH